MKSNKLVFGATLLGLAIAAISATASATPTLYSMLLIDGTGNVNSWNDCSGGPGRPVNAESWGYNSSGTNICSASAYVSGSWNINTGSCASGTTHVAHIRRSFLVDCTAPSISWTLQHNCGAFLLTKLKGAADNTCANHWFLAYGQGLN